MQDKVKAIGELARSFEALTGATLKLSGALSGNDGDWHWRVTHWIWTAPIVSNIALFLWRLRSCVQFRLTGNCGNACNHVEPYGWVPEDGCPIHDKFERPQMVSVMSDTGSLFLSGQECPASLLAIVDYFRREVREIEESGIVQPNREADIVFRKEAIPSDRREE